MRIEFTVVGGNQINYSDSLAQISMILSFSAAFFPVQFLLCAPQRLGFTSLLSAADYAL